RSHNASTGHKSVKPFLGSPPTLIRSGMIDSPFKFVRNCGVRAETAGRQTYQLERTPSERNEVRIPTFISSQRSNVSSRSLFEIDVVIPCSGAGNLSLKQLSALYLRLVFHILDQIVSRRVNLFAHHHDYPW